MPLILFEVDGRYASLQAPGCNSILDGAGCPVGAQLISSNADENEQARGEPSINSPSYNIEAERLVQKANLCNLCGGLGGVLAQTALVKPCCK